ncbi:MAG TPA: dolichyl-phosphate beta-glucosyltransferase [Vicinamibacterales bacterium]|jgi:dolichyl-phosphate beta-glucosyltransferase|nr:dolichyl-phosphate beta-glucosyltransferase [Vicinamibacterales bacterium]
MLSVVIPAYNEAGRLAATLAALREYLDGQRWDWEIRVVDDGSTDGTARVAESVAAGDPRMAVQREPHRGKGGAVKAGLLAARGEFRFICDADLSMAIHELARFMPPDAPPFDIAIGSREGASARRVGEPAYRHLVGRVFNRVVQVLALPGIEDSQCGFKMFTAAAVASVFPRVDVEGWAFDVEALAIARAQGLRIIEVPIEWHYRKDSRLSMCRDGVAMLRELLRIRGNIKSGRYR